MTNKEPVCRRAEIACSDGDYMQLEALEDGQPFYASDLLDVWELGVDDPPAGSRDIRGSIRNRSGRVFGCLGDDGREQYFAAVPVDVTGMSSEEHDRLVAAAERYRDGLP